jgi:hypothetical protein
VDVVRDLHHDDGERHREAGHTREEGDRAQQGEGTCDEKFFVYIWRNCRRTMQCRLFMIFCYGYQ